MGERRYFDDTNISGGVYEVIERDDLIKVILTVEKENFRIFTYVSTHKQCVTKRREYSLAYYTKILNGRINAAKSSLKLRYLSERDNNIGKKKSYYTRKI